MKSHRFNEVLAKPEPELPANIKVVVPWPRSGPRTEGRTTGGRDGPPNPRFDEVWASSVSSLR